MKRFLLIILALAVTVFCGCSDEQSDETVSAANDMNSAIEKANNETKLDGEYTLSLTFDKGKVLYHAQGDVAWDRAEKTAYAGFDQTYLGASVVMRNYYSDGKMISVADGESQVSDRKSSELFSKFPYFSLPKYDDSCGKITVGQNSAGTSYTFERSDAKQLFDVLVGGDIYSLVYSIKNPQPEKTEYGNVECVYTVSDGKIVSCRYEFDVKLFDTPTYIPGYSQSEDEYTIDLHITAKITYNSFGDSVAVEEYSAPISDTESK